MIKISDLRNLEIINANDGKRLGPIKDIELDLDKGIIKGIILPGINGAGLLSIFSKNDDLIVPWDKIIRIGIDVILVDVATQQGNIKNNLG
ncbi:MAG: YlmC/YmxH family sporulation protein [Clostridia bacterium]|nr:YlmC/YmxH family sporulation protein [Clostridia bacterium]MDD4047852.1 YlmC/YmxH family sporulation protein [Clostridia bacterium]